VFSLSHIVFDNDDEDGNDLEANGEKAHSGEETSECSAGKDEEAIKVNGGHDVAEIEVINGVALRDDITANSEVHEELPIAGPGGIKTFLRIASMRKPEVTRIRSSNIRFDGNDSGSMYSTSSCGASYDHGTIQSSRR
jgi:hypothetical protein